MTCVARRSGPMVNTVRIDPLTPGDLLRELDGFLLSGKPHVVHFLAADPTVRARRDPGYRRILNGGDLNVPDGMGIVWAVRLWGVEAVRLPGTEGMHLVAGWGLERGLPHYLFGGSRETLAACRRALETSHPGIRIAGAESPPFREPTETELKGAADRIRLSGARVVWVGLGTPKQDVVAERLRAHEAAPVIACVGAAFDFVAGTKRRAPHWMRRSGLEWVHRLASEPTRLWRRYLIGNPVFAAGVLTDRILGRRPSGAQRS
jgi:N-acetylglucosaminyldiphosphoundecaprenol N-acetyl-beta-D-mannosaminyltransferase